jgi:hypothetical protein
MGRRAPWERPRPSRRPKKLSSGEKREARALAKKAGRPYPNLVDNMRVARKKKG